MADPDLTLIRDLLRNLRDDCGHHDAPETREEAEAALAALDALVEERDRARAKIGRLRHGCAACGTSKDMRGVNLENGHRFTLCRDCRELAPAALPMTSTEIRLRRLALVPMAPGEVPTEPEGGQ